MPQYVTHGGAKEENGGANVVPPCLGDYHHDETV